MSKTALCLPLLLLAVAPMAHSLALSATKAASEVVLKVTEHKKVGKLMAEWIEARSTKKGIRDAEEDLWDEVEKWKKKTKGMNPLSLTGDLGQALWWSNDYGRQKGLIKGKVKDIEGSDGNGPLNYTILAPAKYNAKKAYPLILVIAEDEKKPFEYLTTDWVNGDLRDGAIVVGVHMPEKVENWTVVKDLEGNFGGVANILRTFGLISKKYAIDFDKVFLAGRMDGLQAAMVTANKFTDRFAGVIGRTGDPKNVPVDNFKNIATFFAGGGDGATKFNEAIEKAGYANCTVFPEAKEEDVWSWIQKTSRNGNPSEVVLVPGNPNEGDVFPVRSHWLQVPPWDGEGTARVTGKIDRETNTVTIEGNGVVSVVVSFNDTLVDMDKPITVICNGTENVDTIPRNREITLSYILSTRNDPGKFYTAQGSYDLPALASAEESGGEDAGGGESEQGK